MDNEQIKINEMLERMKSLAKSTIEEFKVEFQVGSKREYKPNEHKLYFVAEDINQMTDRQIMAEVLHNIWHAIYTVMPWRDTKITLPKPARMFVLLLNTVEDIRIEEQMMMVYPWVYDNFLYKFRKQDSEISAKVEWDLEKHLQYVYMLQRQFWWCKLINAHPEVLEALEQSQEFLQEAYWKLSTIEMLEYIKWDLRDIFERLLPEEKEEEQKQDKKEPVSVEKMVNEMKSKSEKIEPQEWEEKEDFKKDIDAELDEQAIWIDATVQRYEKWDEVLDWWHWYTPETDEDNYEKVSYRILYKEVLPVIPFFVKKLSSIMTDNRYNRQWWNYRSWKLNNKKLYRWKCNSDKIFSRKIIRRHKDYAVTLLVDESGSMSGSKSRNAEKATVLFAEVLNKVWIPFEIESFNTKHRTYKKFAEKFSWKHRNNIENIVPETWWENSWWNNDWYAIARASAYLNKYWNTDTEKILIVLSDWQPAESYEKIPKNEKKDISTKKNCYSDFDLSYEIKKSSRNITVIGVWINSSHVTNYYSNNIICSDVNELPKMLLRQLKKNIKRW